jgi:predicted ArsR family transcriptional regulator
LQERFRDKPLEVSRISELAELLRRLGYTVEVTAVGTSEYLLTIKHCPISNVAADFPEVCEAELQMQREALGAKVSLNRTIFQGGSNCHYRILFQQKP